MKIHITNADLMVVNALRQEAETAKLSLDGGQRETALIQLYQKLLAMISEREQRIRELEGCFSQDPAIVQLKLEKPQ